MFNIPGVDTKKGLAGLMGKQERYINMLGVFCSEGKAKLLDIAAALDARDLRLYTIYIHGIKSTAASIGATELSQAAAALETAARCEDLGFVDKHNPSFLANFTNILANIDNFLTEIPEAAMETEAATATAMPTDLLKALREAFLAFDSRTISKQTAALKDYAALPGLGGAVEEILTAKRLGEYEAAVIIIDKLLNGE